MKGRVPIATAAAATGMRQSQPLRIRGRSRIAVQTSHTRDQGRGDREVGEARSGEPGAARDQREEGPPRLARCSRAPGRPRAEVEDPRRDGQRGERDPVVGEQVQVLEVMDAKRRERDEEPGQHRARGGAGEAAREEEGGVAAEHEGDRHPEVVREGGGGDGVGDREEGHGEEPVERAELGEGEARPRRVVEQVREEDALPLRDRLVDPPQVPEVGEVVAGEAVEGAVSEVGEHRGERDEGRRDVDGEGGKMGVHPSPAGAGLVAVRSCQPSPRREEWWAQLDSNQRPAVYETAALTT